MSTDLCPGISWAASGPGLCPTRVRFLTPLLPSYGSQAGPPRPSPQAKVPGLPRRDAKQPFRDGETRDFRAQGHLTPGERRDVEIPESPRSPSHVRHWSG